MTTATKPAFLRHSMLSTFQGCGRKIDTHELAWAAGFFDGEGCAYSHRPKPRYGLVRPRPNLTVSQVDVRALDRFHRAVLGIGTIAWFEPPSRTKLNAQGIHTWRVQNAPGVLAVVALLWKYLSPAKREQVTHVMLEWKAVCQLPRAEGRQPACKRGHLFTEENTRRLASYPGYRWCRACEKVRRQEARARAKAASS